MAAGEQLQPSTGVSSRKRQIEWTSRRSSRCWNWRTRTPGLAQTLGRSLPPSPGGGSEFLPPPLSPRRFFLFFFSLLSQVPHCGYQACTAMSVFNSFRAFVGQSYGGLRSGPIHYSCRFLLPACCTVILGRILLNPGERTSSVGRSPRPPKT